MIRLQLQQRRGEFELNLDLQWPARGITALFGPSGAGKSSIIQAIAGLTRPTAGQIRFQEHCFYDSQAGICLPIEARRLGYVFQDARLFPHMNVHDNLLYGYQRAPAPRRIELAQVLAVLGLEALLNRRPQHLSGGEKQRVALGRALLSQPRWLLLDEPLAALDQARKDEILTYIEALRDEFDIPMLYVSHNLAEVTRLADHLLLLNAGRLLAAAPLAEIMADPQAVAWFDPFELGAVWPCQLIRHDPEQQLSYLAFADGELRVPLLNMPLGRPLRARLRARDIAIALQAHADTSVLNQLPGEIIAIQALHNLYRSVSIRIGHVSLHALITAASAQALALQPGMRVWAFIKSVALDQRP